MKLEIEVKRRRFSVTQGQADVYVNGEMVISFGDTIEIINDGQPYYSEKIGNWARYRSGFYVYQRAVVPSIRRCVPLQRKSKKNPGCGVGKVGDYELAY